MLRALVQQRRLRGDGVRSSRLRSGGEDQRNRHPPPRRDWHWRRPPRRCASPRSGASRAAGLVLGILLLAGAPGCSLVFTRGPSPSPPATPESPPAECTESPAAPIADTVLAAGFLALAIWAIVEAVQPCPHPPESSDAICPNGLAYFPAGGAALASALFTASAVVGYSRTSACRAAPSRPALSGPLSAPVSPLRPRIPEGCTWKDAPTVCALDLGLGASLLPR